MAYKNRRNNKKYHNRRKKMNKKKNTNKKTEEIILALFALAILSLLAISIEKSEYPRKFG